MKRTMFFAERNAKELLRDPLNLFFCILFPMLLLCLLTLIDRSIPSDAGMSLFEISSLAPGIAVFSLIFLSLFSALLIAKDRGSSLILRLLISPLRGSGFILGYTLPLLPMAIAQTLICFAAALPLGLRLSWNLLLCVAVLLPIMVVDIALGMLCGTVFNEKAAGGVVGALLSNVTAWLSGIWFSLDLIGGAFRTVAYALPFANAVDAARAAISGDYGAIFGHLWIVIVWAVGLTALASIVFSAKRTAK